MAKKQKRKRGPTLDQLLARPWCYYCERDFDDMMILTSHQKAKHFKCDKCGRRLNTAGGLSVHMNQVHKEQLEKVENAMPNRSDPGIEIFGTEGIPEDVMREHKQQVIQKFHQDAADRQAKTGNPQPGANSGPAPKRPKLADERDLAQRFNDWLAKKKAAEAAAEAGNANTYPYPTAYSEQYAFQQAPPGQQPYAIPPTSSTSPPQHGGIGQPPGLPHLPTATGMQPTHQNQAQSQNQVSLHPAKPTQPMEKAAGQASEAAGNEVVDKKAKKGKPTRLIFEEDSEANPEERFAKTG